MKNKITDDIEYIYYATHEADKKSRIDHLVVLSDGSEIDCPTKRWAELVRAEQGLKK